MRPTAPQRTRPPGGRILLVGLAAALACAGCAAGTSEAAAPVANAAPAAAAMEPAVEPVGPADTRPKEVPGGYGTVTRPFGRLTAVRVAAQNGFDRIVLQFDSDLVPGYRVAY